MGDRPEDWVEPKILELKQGVDEELEADADKLLMESVRPNERSTKRDWEKLSYEFGRIAEEDLAHYDPRNDWETQDSAFTLLTDLEMLDYLDRTICDDGNVRARNQKMLERQRLMHIVKDNEDWGSPKEEIPLLGVNEGPRKTCARCKQAKGLQFFSPGSRNADGLRSWCKDCEKVARRRRYTTKSRSKRKTAGRRRVCEDTSHSEGGRGK